LLLSCAVAVAAADPLFDALYEVKFINSGTVKATDRFWWGITTSGRDPKSTAANPTAGKVLYLEKYNISNGGWGAGGAFPYLWKVQPAAAASAAAAACIITKTMPKVRRQLLVLLMLLLVLLLVLLALSPPPADPAPCNMQHDMPGDDMKVTPSPSAVACGAACCKHAGCGGFVWIARSEDKVLLLLVVLLL